MEWLQIAGAITGITAALAALVWIARSLGRIGKNVTDLKDDFLGEPARPGVRGRPGVMERLAKIESELHPNSGLSVRDAVNRCEVALGDVSGRLGGLETRLSVMEGQGAQTPVQVNVGGPPKHA